MNHQEEKSALQQMIEEAQNLPAAKPFESIPKHFKFDTPIPWENHAQKRSEQMSAFLGITEEDRQRESKL